MIMMEQDIVAGATILGEDGSWTRVRVSSTRDGLVAVLSMGSGDTTRVLGEGRVVISDRLPECPGCHAAVIARVAHEAIDSAVAAARLKCPDVPWSDVTYIRQRVLADLAAAGTCDEE